MKINTLALGAISLAQLAAAQPHRHAHRHIKRDADVIVTETLIDTVYAQATGPSVIIFVDQNGVPVTTMTEGLVGDEVKLWSTAFGARPAPSAPVAAPVVAAEAVPTSFTTIPIAVAPTTEAAAPAVVVPEVKIEVAATPTPTPTPVVEAPASVVEAPTSVVEAPATSTVAPAPASSSASSSSSGSGFGFSYSPYHANGKCKSQDEVNADFALIGDGYSVVRIYGVDCDQTATVLSAAKSKGLKLFAGIYDLTNLQDAVSKLSAAAGGDWSDFDGVSVGNEVVNGGGSPATVIAAIGTVRSLLRSAGFTGPVGTVDTLVAARANPGLCDASDRCTVNCHPFFDGQVAAEGAGDFLETQIPTLRAVLANKNQEIIITETGWPWQGETNGLAVPSKSNQAAAISSIKSKFASNPSGVILFTAFNDLWKSNTKAQFGAEQYWGFIGDSPSN